MWSRGKLLLKVGQLLPGNVRIGRLFANTYQEGIKEIVEGTDYIYERFLTWENNVNKSAWFEA